MRISQSAFDAVTRWAAEARATWARMSPDAPERLVTPGSPGFRCQPHSCDALCCHSPYLAGVSERDVALLRAGGAEPLTFLDIDPGRLEELFGQGMRWSQFVTLRQEEGRCGFLNDDLSCGAYERRPDGCALYPHRLVFAPRGGDRIATNVESVDLLDQSVRVALGWEPGEPPYVPLVLRDLACPGFTEPALGETDYAALLERVWQVDACTNHAWPCERHTELA